MSETKIINVAFGKSRDATTSARYRYDYGQVIEVVGINLPETFEARFSNSPHGESIRVIGTQNKVEVPDGLFLTGEPIYCYITVHDEATDGRTMYSIKIPVKNSTERTDADPTPVEQDVITQAIASLNNAIDRTTENVEITNTNVELAQESAMNAQSFADSASTSAENAQSSAESASESAVNANNSSMNAEVSAVRASGSETHVEQMVTEVEQIAQRAETASNNAESSATASAQKAADALNSANTASAKADEASGFANDAQGSANSAQGYANSSGQSATNAQTYMNSASISANQAQLNAEKTQSDKEVVESAKSNVLSAVNEAQTYATTAQSASQAIQDMNVEAVTLGVNSDVTVEKSVDPVTGAVTLTYGIPKGVKGEKGDKGDQGIQGEQGERGEKGDTGSKGDKGDPFVYSDFTPEQLASLKGEKGDKGDQGERGEQGIQGVQGEKGDAFTYADFTPEQLASLKGEKGDKGDAFEYSDFTPQQLASLKGDKGDAFEYSDFTPEQLVSLKGEKGDTGNTGAKGDTGDSGVYVGTSAPSDESVNVWINPNAKDSDVAVIVDSIPTQGSTNAVSSGGVYSTLQTLESKIPDIDDTLAQTGQAADAKAVGDAIDSVNDDITDLKQNIITGVVSIGTWTEEVSPSATDFQVAKITPKNGNVIANSAAYMNIDGVGGGYYTLMSTDFLSDDIKSIQSAYSSIKFVLFVYDKTTSEYLGAIFDGYVYKNISDLTSSNTLYPYSGINMDTVKEMFPNYKYKLEITDTAVNGSTLPTPSDIINWCTYTVSRATVQRQLVKTVNGTAPDNSGNIELNFIDSIDAVPTTGSENPVASGGVKTAIDAVMAEIPDIDDTLTQVGQMADAKAVGDEINDLKQDIIDGKVAIGAGTQNIIPNATDFRVSRITPKNGTITDNSGAYMNIGGVGNTYYPLITTDFLPDNIKAIQSNYSDVKFVLFVYDKTSSEYLGAIYQEYTFKSKEDLSSSNTLYPYTEVNMDTMRTMFPTYKYRLEITDVSANQSARPVTTDITQWCTYTVPRTTAQRQLVKTVNNITPDNSGNIEVAIPDVDVYERIPLDSSELREGFYRYDTGISNRSYQAVIIPKGDQSIHTYYGIVFKDILADNIYKIEASGTIYALIASWNRTDGSFVGYYTGSGFEIPEREINANNVDTQNINLKVLRGQYPNYFFKVSFVDVSTYDSPSMDDVLDSVAFVYESASKYELGKVSDTNIPELPAYWVDFLNEKIEDIRENMTSVGRNGETFIFITDLHWPNNVKNSPRLMFEILRKLNIHHCICGGDVINEGTREESVSVMVDVVNAFKHYNIDFLTALGNHDRNWNTYNDQHSYPERRFSEADIFALLERMSKRVYQNFADDKFDNGIGFNMYYDDPITNTRFIIIDINDVITDPDTGTNTFEFTNYNELAQVLHDSNGKHVVIISHMLEAGNNIGTRLATISDALNARTTINTDYCTVDFTGCTGKVHLILGGHAHGDSSRLSSGGIPIVTCDTDSNLSHNTDAHIDGTTKEQAFDVITINYADNSVKFVRIGRGSDRTFTA